MPNDLVVPLRTPAPPVDVDFTNDGTRIAVAVAAMPGTASVLVYDTRTGERLSEYATGEGYGHGVAFAAGGLYSTTETADATRLELSRLESDGSRAPITAFPCGGGGLIRNRDGDLLAVLTGEATVFHLPAAQVVRVVSGMPGRVVQACLPAWGGSVYCSGVVPDHLIRWDLEENRETGRWPTAVDAGVVTVSDSGRYALVSAFGFGPVSLVDTEENIALPADRLVGRPGLCRASFTLAEDALVCLAGGRAALVTLNGPSAGVHLSTTLGDGLVNHVHRARNADVYAFVSDDGVSLVRLGSA